jgi:hypothetical protein
LIHAGTIASGMLPKKKSCLEALDADCKHISSQAMSPTPCCSRYLRKKGLVRRLSCDQCIDPTVNNTCLVCRNNSRPSWPDPLIDK